MIPPKSHLSTHEVTNQPEVPRPADGLRSNQVLRDPRTIQGGDNDHLARYAAALVEANAMTVGKAAQRMPPGSMIFDRRGRRRDKVRFDPAYHRLLYLGLSHGYAAEGAIRRTCLS